MKLLDQVRHKLRLLHYAWDTEQSYVRWIERYIVFHKRGDLWRHPRDLGAPEIEQFLGYLADERNVSASTQNQAFGALLFLYQKVLEIDLPLVNAPRPPAHPPVVAREARRGGRFGRSSARPVTPGGAGRRAPA